MGKLILLSLSLIIIQLSLCLTTTNAQSCKSFSPNNKKYKTCNDLPELNSYLYWTYDSVAGTADIAFRATGVNPSSNWVAWALNPTGQGMTGAQSLVALQNSSGVMYAYTSDVQGYATTLAKSSLSFQVEKLTAMSRGNKEIIIMATIKPPKTTVNQVWQVGPVSGGTPGQHPLLTANKKSSATINFLSGQTTSSGSVPGSTQKNKNIHGVLNAISWGTLMPLGGIIARYLRVFKSADPAWFYIHITCQTSAYILGVAGWGTGLKLGSESVGIVYHAHRNIGITLFCLATLQVFALLLRPKKDNKYRLYWNIYHHAIGYSVIILSVINIYKGFDILEPLKKWKTTYTGIIIALGVLAIALEVFTWAVVLKRKKDGPAKHGHHGNGSNPYGARTQPMV
ncbi:cytochrome b561 and DOMON domain-containing protein At5g47530-like [Silene latifolia]|uniref:cytochrome b561 and DOMON domain-containing protein At5g47530-like n=1 Tax=Silene latifolia TaxID=37657 RepID=UPI003D77983F